MNDMIQILPKEIWQGYELIFEYETSYFYDAQISQTGSGFNAAFIRKPFDSTVNKRFTDHLFQSYWEGSEAFGVFGDDKLIACLEIWKEDWSNRLRITQLNVVPDSRRKGLGKALMDFAKKKAVGMGLPCGHS